MIRVNVTTLNNQDISAGLECSAYTADADNEIFFRLFADQVQGNGTYYAWLTIQRNGAGVFYRMIPITAALADNGVTSINFSTIPLPVKSGDVIKVYLKGLVGDTTTPDIITETWKQINSTLVAGAYPIPFTIDDGVNPLDNVDVWITTDVGGANIVARGFTDMNGLVTLMLDPGDYYCWKALKGYTFANPEAFNVPIGD